MLDLPAAGYDTVCHTESNSLPCIPPFAISRNYPFQTEKVVLPGYGVAPAISVAHGVRHPGLRPRVPISRRWQRFLRYLSNGPKNLPVPFEAQAVVIQPPLHEKAELLQLPFVRPGGGHVVHIPHIMGAQPALPDELVQGLQDGIGEPLRRVGPYHNPILDNSPDEVQDPPVFE